MNNFFSKFVLFPLMVYIADMLSPQINFYSPWQPIVIGLVIGASAYVIDSLLLGRISNLTVTWLDIAVFTLITWSFSLIFRLSHITFPGSLFTGILVGFIEYLTHRSLLAARRREIM